MNKVLVALALFAPAFAADECAVTEVDAHSTGGGRPRLAELDEANPCIDAALGYAPLRDDPRTCPATTRAPSPPRTSPSAPSARWTRASTPSGRNAMGMCTVNIHWHIGAEHRSEGVYDETFDFDHPALHDDDAHRKLAWTNGKQRPNGRRKLAGGRVGHMCKNAKDMHDANDPMTKWQYQYHFLDGVLCGATQGNVDIATASALLSDRTHGIGVEGQVYTIVNSADGAHKQGTWDALQGWNKELASDGLRVVPGSTTGDAADNEICRGTGGLMLVISADDMSPDVAPHGARETVSASLSDTPYTP
ncbi:hypothetical protein JL720_15571 [Aureococcus anophagefferens]|nr:hypothetical protein JL720_15571 [Aureococcus anophagefferens]